MVVSEGNLDSVTAHSSIAAPPRCNHGKLPRRCYLELAVTFSMQALRIISLVLLLVPWAAAEDIPLSNHRLLKTDLKQARLIAEMRGYAIIAGRRCVDCDENLSIYIRRIAPRRGGEDTDSGANRYTYPGRYRDYLSEELVEKTRVFYGRCHGNEPALLWLSEYRGAGGWIKSEYVIVFGAAGLEHRYHEGRQPSIFYIEDSRCVELPGIDAETEP